jgi:hypothetical protein
MQINYTSYCQSWMEVYLYYLLGVRNLNVIMKLEFNVGHFKGISGACLEMTAKVTHNYPTVRAGQHVGGTDVKLPIFRTRETNRGERSASTLADLPLGRSLRLDFILYRRICGNQSRSVQRCRREVACPGRESNLGRPVRT